MLFLIFDTTGRRGYRLDVLRLQDFGRNYAGDPKVKIPWVRRDLSGARILVMEWIDGLRCTNPRGIQSSGIDVDEFIRCGVVSGLRQLLEVWRAPAILPHIKSVLHPRHGGHARVLVIFPGRIMLCPLLFLITHLQ